MNPDKRKQLIIDAIALQTREFHHIVLHRQKLRWVAKKNVIPVLTPSNIVRVGWIRSEYLALAFQARKGIYRAGIVDSPYTRPPQSLEK